MVIIRFEPGAEAPIDEEFCLVGHYGEAGGIRVCCSAGERIPVPHVPASSTLERPLAYVRFMDAGWDEPDELELEIKVRRQSRDHAKRGP
jgi:hypothetical protein